MPTARVHNITERRPKMDHGFAVGVRLGSAIADVEQTPSGRKLYINWEQILSGQKVNPEQGNIVCKVQIVKHIKKECQFKCWL